MPMQATEAASLIRFKCTPSVNPHDFTYNPDYILQLVQSHSIAYELSNKNHDCNTDNRKYKFTFPAGMPRREEQIVCLEGNKRIVRLKKHNNCMTFNKVTGRELNHGLQK
jgi:predicted transcriptional regulator